MSQLTPRDMSILLKRCYSLGDLRWHDEAAAGSPLYRGAVEKAFRAYCDSFQDVYHKGNMYFDNKCKHPNVMDTDLVHHYKDDGAHPVMERYGHGRNIAFQIWLESPYVPEHWKNKEWA